MGKNKIRYTQIIPNKSQWPIVKLAKERDKFIEEVTSKAYQTLMNTKKDSIREEIETTIHREKLRMTTNPWRVDPRDEKTYWKEITSQLLDVNSDNKKITQEKEREILKKIIKRYSSEISGNFKNFAYRFAQGFVTFTFARLLNAARVKGLLSLFSRRLDLDDKLHVIGETEHLRSLAKKGTVVMVPTHFSNLDSLLIGWVIYHLGLPPFIYAAGLNLFNIKILSYFMNGLGAFKVDRRKKNSIYLETLKTYSREAIKRGCHSLFFPGGTRSRSGEIETSLKTGLLATSIEAQRELCRITKKGEKARKIFIIPVVINYHFTPEAPALIKEHLRKTGKQRYYVEADEFSTSYKISTFLFKFFTKGSNISVNIGRGMDILGNYVDDEGNSFDKNNNPIDANDYFLRGKKVTVDSQREKEYVRVLAQRIIEEYHKYNQVLTSHLVAFTSFKMLERRNPKLDLYHILRLPNEDLELDYEKFRENFKTLKTQLNKIYQKGLVDIDEYMKGNVTNAITHGLQNVGLYHNQRPLIKKKDKIIVQDTNTLYYYHNRMNGYGLEKFI